MARRRTSTRNTGLQVEGLAEAQRALKKISPELQKELVSSIREEAKAVTLEARKLAPRVSPTAPSNPNWVGWAANTRGAGVKLRASGSKSWNERALQTEFGTKWWKVGWDDGADLQPEWRPQRSFRRRTARRPNPDGYVIQPTIRRMLPETLDNVADHMLRVFSKALTRAGVPRGT